MNQLLEAWEEENASERFEAEFVNFADDFVVATRGKAREALEWVRSHVEDLGLQLNKEKTEIRDVDGEGLNFLGYTFKRKLYKPKGTMYMAAVPSRESLDRFKEELRHFLKIHRTTRWKEVFKKLWRKLVGWVNHHSYGSTYERMKELKHYLYDRLVIYMKQTGQKVGGNPTTYLGWLVCKILNPNVIIKKLRKGSVWDLL